MTIRAPHFSPRRERPIQQPIPVVNLLITTLAVIAAVPFVANEQPIPQIQQPQQPDPRGFSALIIEETQKIPAQSGAHQVPEPLGIQQPFQIGS